MQSKGDSSAPIPEKIPVNPDGVTLYERIGPDGIERLVQSFYGKARYEPVLEPVFSAHVEDWPEHIANITQFWFRMTGGPSKWAGGMGRHFFLNLEGAHFQAWLRVWEENCRELLPDREASEMTAFAQNIGRDLEAMIQRRAR